MGFNSGFKGLILRAEDEGDWLFRKVCNHGFTVKIFKGKVYWQYLLRRISWHTEQELTTSRTKFTKYFKTPTHNCRVDEIEEDGVRGSCFTCEGSYKCTKDDTDLVEGNKQRAWSTLPWLGAVHCSPFHSSQATRCTNGPFEFNVSHPDEFI